MNGSNIDHRGRGRGLYEEIKAHVVAGTFAAGAALPSTRACAAERGLSRTTVSAVYEQLAAEGMRPTNETVRELLAKWTSTKGGSYATIGPLLRAWKAIFAHPPKTENPPAPDLCKLGFPGYRAC